ncbi:hypothetical protein HHK36_013946 [Tetracentron sinense]|uniref:endo-polygalacturonase n=1 Tax=Tetracentron sinense TaxID=13715 RepID=A0A834Z764_TETSI|nr:hypothetical protein HHK36_013946 [Tetracentron sinense]
MNYGAVGDGNTDDSQAFLKAWEATCADTGSPGMTIPKSKTFLVKTVKFNGPCKSSSVTVQILGTMVAPDSPTAWTSSELWLMFKGVNGLTIGGNGILNGRGSKWWDQSCKTNEGSMLNIFRCSDVFLRNLNFMDSPQFHIKIENSERVHVDNLDIKSPETSPNTDGIHIQESQYVYVQASVIGTGDDCISIGDRSLDVNISNIVCGPGHGVSIGSLGKGGMDVSVERITVKYVKYVGTTNGARIKTWQGGTGHASQITFEQLDFSNVKNPIIIDQYYCDQDKACKNVTGGVKISDVTYRAARGTSSTATAIDLQCDETVECTNIIVDDVMITTVDQGEQAEAYCSNAHGMSYGIVQPQVPCLST